ncbi:MAG: hypothetical protein PHP56_12290 [Smithellaceae bacterium]|nr:hypothetical protein [Smithellaceae bacterium]
MNSQSNSRPNSIDIKSDTTLRDDLKNTYVMTNSLSSRKRLFALVFNSTGHFVGVVEEEMPKTGAVQRCFKKLATIIRLLFGARIEQATTDQPPQSTKWGLGK